MARGGRRRGKSRRRRRRTWRTRLTDGWAALRRRLVMIGGRVPGTLRSRGRLSWRARFLAAGGWRGLPWRPLGAGLAVAGTVALLVPVVRLGPGAFGSGGPKDAEMVRALPVLPALPLEFEGVTLETYLQAWVPYAERDELLRSTVLRDPDFARDVHGWLDYWTGPASRWFPGFLERMVWLGSHVDSALTAQDLPPSLRYLPLIESGYAPGVTSRASAVGLWQLMTPTARGLGLEVSSLVDERRHVERSTEAALRYLSALNNEFDSWFWTLAAYNSGPTRVRGILRRHASDQPRTDSLFWALRDHFAPETRAFLPKLYGAMWVASRPDAYGYELPQVEPLAYDVVQVPDRTTLDIVARAAGATTDEVARLNPQLVRGITPPGRLIDVKVPAGHADEFALHFPLIPAGERVSYIEHVVRAGETLSRIASRYGVRTGDIEAANPDVSARALPVGARLTVPVAPGAESRPDR